MFFFEFCAADTLDFHNIHEVIEFHAKFEIRETRDTDYMVKVFLCSAACVEVELFFFTLSSTFLPHLS